MLAVLLPPLYDVFVFPLFSHIDYYTSISFIPPSRISEVKIPYSPVYSTHFFVSILVLKTRMRTIFGCVLSKGRFCCFGEKGIFTRELTIHG